MCVICVVAGVPGRALQVRNGNDASRYPRDPSYPEHMAPELLDLAAIYNYITAPSVRPVAGKPTI